MRVGVDIGGTNTDAVVLDGAGAVAHSLRLPTGWGHEAVLGTATDAVLRLAGQAGIAASSFDSIGVGIPGAVDAERGIVTHARNLGVAQLDLGQLLGANLGAPVRVENDVNAAALGAFHQLGLAPTTSMAYLNLGTGLAAGLVLGGQLWRGARGAAGEIGHILIDPAGPLDQDGQPGALEVMASGSGIASQRPGSVSDMLVAAAAGDAGAVAIRERMFGAIASAVRILVLTVDVELVVIGGGISTMGDVLLTAVRQVFSEWESSSPFIASLELGDRLRILPPDIPTAATGAAWLGATPWQK
ncbi:MAG TPA: ROK family protein [Galbitalea sp.]